MNFTYHAWCFLCRDFLYLHRSCLPKIIPAPSANETLLQTIFSVGFGLSCSIRFLHMREALCYNRWQEPSKMMEPIVRTL